jgi:hypothetical protein
MELQYGTLAHIADEHGYRLSTAGLALEALVNLLGHDGGEHHISDTQMYGLTCAVHSISMYVRDAGILLCEKVELEVRP